MNSDTPDGVADALRSYLDAIDQVVADNVTDDDIEARLRRLTGQDGPAAPRGAVSCPSRRHGGETKPRPQVAQGLRICADCRDAVEDKLVEMSALYELSTHMLDSQHEAMLVLGVVASWCGLVASERGVTGPDESNIRKLVGFLAVHLHWLCQHPAAPELVDELTELYNVVTESLEPNTGAGHVWAPEHWLSLRAGASERLSIRPRLSSPSAKDAE